MNNNITTLSKKHSSLTIDDIANYCERNEVTVDVLCAKLKELLNAKRFDGWQDVADSNVQLKALMVGLDLLRLVNTKTDIAVATVTHQMAPGDIERLEVIAKELKGLEYKLVDDKIQQGSVDADYVAVRNE